MSTEPKQHLQSYYRNFYQRYYEEKGADRNDILRNRGVLFQSFAADVALIKSLSRIGFSPSKSSVLDVGGGSGGSLVPFLGLGVPDTQLVCVDIQLDRITKGQARLVGIKFCCADATALPYGDATFDIVFASTVFIQMTDDEIASRIAGEMTRVVKPTGYILIRDWAIQKPGGTTYLAVTPKRLRRMFGARANILFRENGALLPPLGRFLSTHAQWAYFLVQKVCPFLVGMKVNVLRPVTASTSEKQWEDDRRRGCLTS